MFPDDAFFLLQIPFFKKQHRAEHTQKVQIFSLLNWTGRSLDNTVQCVHICGHNKKFKHTSIKNASYD